MALTCRLLRISEVPDSCLYPFRYTTGCVKIEELHVTLIVSRDNGQPLLIYLKDILKFIHISLF